MTSQNQPALVAAAEQMQNPLAFRENGVPVYRVRKNDDDPRSPLQKYWYSFFADNCQPIDVRTLPGYDEPAYELGGDVLARSERWNLALATEAERVLRLAIQSSWLALPPTVEAGWDCPYCGHQQAAKPLPENGEQWGRCPACGAARRADFSTFNPGALPVNDTGYTTFHSSSILNGKMSPDEAFLDLVNKIHAQFGQVHLPANKAGCANGLLLEKLDEIERAWRETRYPIMKGQAAELTKQIYALRGTDQERLLDSIKLLSQLLIQDPETIAAALGRFVVGPSPAKAPAVTDAARGY